MRKRDQPSGSPRHESCAANRHNGASGTALANIDLLDSCGSIPARGTWGGARNSASRTSWHLTLAQCRSLLAAAGHAERIGLRFNRHWTVHYQDAGIAEADAARFIGRLLKLAGDYARTHEGRLVAVWVREAGEGKGGHVHILLHLRADLPLKGRTRRWVRLAGGRCVKGVSVVRSIGGRLQSADSGSEHYAHNLAMVRSYLLKGAAHQAGKALGLRRYGENGFVVGKRCGWTQNVGRAARQGADIYESRAAEPGF